MGPRVSINQHRFYGLESVPLVFGSNSRTYYNSGAAEYIWKGGLGLGISTSSLNYQVFDQAKNNTVRKSGGDVRSNPPPP